MRLIDADELRKRAYPFPCAIGVEYAVTLRAIGDAPTIDPESLRPVGHWVKQDEYTECSNCEYWYNSPETETADDREPYCPRCGARMEVQDDD